MKKRLFDFTPAYAVIAIVAYSLLLTLFGYSYFSGGGILYLVLFILFIISFLFVFGYFVVLSVKLDEDGISQGDKKIEKKYITYLAGYDSRYKESVILIRDKRIDYHELDKKAKKKKSIRVQATRANLMKLGEYLDCEIVLQPEPKHRLFSHRK